MSKKESKSRRKRRTKAYRRAVIAIDLFFLFVIVFGLILVLAHTFTKKEKYREEALALYEAEDYEGAIKYFDKALNCNQWFSDDINVDCSLYKAECYVETAQFDEAKKTYQTILDEYNEKHYNKTEIEFLVSLMDNFNLYNQGEYFATVAKFVDAVERGYTEISLYVAICYENQHNYEKMKEYYDIYSQRFGMNSYLYYKYATYYILSEDYNTALSYISDGFVCSDTKYLEQLKYAEILCYERMNQYEYAYSLASNFIGQYPDNQNGADLYSYLDTRVNISPIPLNDKFELYVEPME